MSDRYLLSELKSTFGEMAFMLEEIYSKAPYVADEKARMDALHNRALKILDQFECFESFDDDE